MSVRIADATVYQQLFILMLANTSLNPDDQADTRMLHASPVTVQSPCFYFALHFSLTFSGKLYFLIGEKDRSTQILDELDIAQH